MFQSILLLFFVPTFFFFIKLINFLLFLDLVIIFYELHWIILWRTYFLFFVNILIFSVKIWTDGSYSCRFAPCILFSFRIFELSYVLGKLQIKMTTCLLFRQWSYEIIMYKIVTSMTVSIPYKYYKSYCYVSHWFSRKNEYGFADTPIHLKNTYYL